MFLLAKFNLSPIYVKEIFADDISQARLLLVLRDKFGNIITDKPASEVSFKAYDEEGKETKSPDITVLDTVVSEDTENYIATLHAQKAGNYKIVPIYAGKELEDISKTLTIKLPYNNKEIIGKSFTSDKNEIRAGNQDVAKLTLELATKDQIITEDDHHIKFKNLHIDGDDESNDENDAIGDRVDPSLISFIVKNGADKEVGSSDITLSDIVIEDAKKAIYSLTFKGTKTDTYKIIPIYDGKEFNYLEVSIEITAKGSEASAQKSVLRLDPERLAADGITATTVSLAIKDKFGEPNICIF